MRKLMHEVRLERISPNLRCVCDEGSLQALCRSIRRKGQIEPILIWFDGLSFKILDGEKRWRACRRLRIKTIRAVIVKFNALAAEAI